MAGFRSGVQIIVQTDQGRGNLFCQGFAGFPVVNPCLIVLLTNGSTDSLRNAETLRWALEAELLSVGGATPVAVPCSGLCGSLFDCHAHDVATAHKLLIVVGDSSTPFPAGGGIDVWMSRDDSYSVISLLPAGSDPTTLLPPSLKLQNVSFWSQTPVEFVPQLLGSVELTSRESRIFISYRRQDTQRLCDQLFDSLSHKNFDVYQDRFRSVPGVNFKLRLEQELRDKATVLLLESSGLPQSVWVPFEIATAKQLRLGILALGLPGAPDMLGIPTPAYNQGIRFSLQASDFVGDDPSLELEASSLGRVLAWIDKEHGRALIRRRQIMSDNLRGALLAAGALAPQVGTGGLMRVQAAPPTIGKEYAVLLTTRTSELNDFHTVDTNLTAPAKGVIIGPGLVDMARNQQISWLASTSRIERFDEGLLQDAAEQMAQGAL